MQGYSVDIQTFLYLAAIFGAAYFTKHLTDAIKIPEVTGYVLLGVVFGSIGLLNTEVLAHLQPLSTLALGIVAFLIGVEIRMDTMRKLGRSIPFIVLFEGLGAFIVVYPALRLIVGVDNNTALILAAIASATAPAATVAVIRQYKAKGPLTSAILAVVGLDDALTLIIYVFAEGFVVSSMMGQDLNVLATLGAAGLSIILASALGLGLGALFSFVVRKNRNNDWIMLFLAASLLGVLGLAEILHLSELLAAMVFGCVLGNSSPTIARKAESIVSGFTPLFMVLFFVLGGAYLDISLILLIGGIGAVYFFSRAIGKLGGATLGAILGRAPTLIRNKIGLSLLPQVGVAIALAMAVNKKFGVPEMGPEGQLLAQTVINVLLFTTIFTEILGPIMTRSALRSAGEIGKSDSS